MFEQFIEEVKSLHAPTGEAAFPVPPSKYGSFFLSAYQIQGWIVAMLLMNVLSGFLSKLLLGKKYTSLSKADRYDWRTRVVSTVHATLVIIYGIIIYFDFKDENETDVIYYASRWSEMSLSMTVSYFAYDLIICIVGGDIGLMILHHITGLGLYIILANQRFHIYGIMLVFTELTTLNFNLMYFLKYLNLRESALYTYNGLMFWFLWTVGRVVFLGYVAVHEWRHREAILLSPAVYTGILVFDTIFYIGINYWWWYRITYGLIKIVFFGNGENAGDETPVEKKKKDSKAKAKRS